MATLGQQAQARGFITSQFAQPRVAPAAKPKPTPKDPAPTSILSQIGPSGAKPPEPTGAGAMFGKGLGMVLNNPIVRTITRPLDVLDVPRRAVWSTINEAADALNGGDASFSDWYDQTNPLHAITQKGDVTFGAGDVLPDIDTGNPGLDKWLNRGVGLAGDIAGDPLTYVGGLGFLPEVGTISSRVGRMTRIEEGLSALEKTGQLTDDIIEGAKKVANTGNWGHADPILREAAQVSDTAGVHMHIPFTDIKTGPLPGTRAVGNKLADVIGGVKGSINASDWGARRIAANVPEELAGSLPKLLSGGADNEKFMKALETIPTVNARKAAAGRVRAVAAKDMNKTIRQIKEYIRAGNTIDDLIRHTEDLSAPATPLNELADRIRRAAADVGVEMPEIADIGYFPHVLSKEFKDLLANGGEDAQRFLDQSGIIRDELMADSGFLQGRKLRGTPERPLTITLPNGRGTTLTQGTVEEINQKMAELFPQMKGTALETDPRTAMERYISGVSDDIGNRAAAKRRLEAGSKYYADISAPKLEGALPPPRQLPPPGQTLAPLEPLQGPVPLPNGPQTVARGVDPFADNPIFKGVKDEAMTGEANAQRADALNRQLAPERVAQEAQRVAVAGEISDTGRLVQGGLEQGKLDVEAALQQQVAPLNERLGDMGTTRADLAVADEVGQQRLGELDPEIADLTPRQRQETATIRGNEKEIRRLTAEIKGKVTSLKEELRRVNAKIASFKSRANRLGRRDAAAWRAGREADVAAARSELARLQEEAHGLRTWGTESQDRLNYQIADKALSDFNNEIKAAQAELDRVTNVTKEVGHLGHGRPPQAQIDEARRYIDTSPNVERYNDAVTKVEAAKAGEAVDPEELAAARKFLRIKPAKKVQQYQELLASVEDIDRKVAKQVAHDPEVRAAERAAANADLKTKRTPAFGQSVGGTRDPGTNKLIGGIEVGLDEIKRLFPERAITWDNVNDVPFTEYLQRLRRSYGMENTAARKGKLAAAVAGQQKNIDIANKGLAELFIGAGDEVAQAARQTEYMWKAFPEEMKRQQLHEQIVSVPAVAQAQMEALDVATQNLRVDYKTTLFNKERRQAERANVQAGLEGREVQRTDMGSVEDALQKQIEFETGKAKRATEHIESVEAIPGKRGVTPDQKISPVKTYGPKKKDLKAFDLHTEPAAVQPMYQTLRDIEQMAMLDPNMNSQTLGSIESLLHQHKQSLRNLTGGDLSIHQTEQLLREASSGRLLDVVAGQLRDTWTMLPGRGDVVIDTELNRMLSNVLNVKAEPGAFGRTLTAFTNFFKTYATLTPGFHIRNAMSAVFMNTVDGVPLKLQREGLELWKQWDNAADPGAWLASQSQEIQDAFEATFASGAGGRFFEAGVSESTATARSRFKEGVYRNRATNLSQRAGERVEGSVRLGMALDTTRNGGSVASAYDRVARIHFDYAAVSKMDEQARKLVPFWTYTSRNLPMQISEMWKKPRVYAWYNSFVRNFEVTPEEFTPEYFESIGAWNTGEKLAGMPLYLQPDMPQQRVSQDLDRLEKALSGENIGQVLSDLNPMFTAPVEYVTGQDMYTGKQYKDTDWTKASGFADKSMLPLLAILGQTKQGADGVYIQDKGMNALRAMIPVLDRTVRMVPGSSGSSGDPARQVESLLRPLGVPIRTLSPQQQQATQRSQYFNKLDEAAMQRVLAGGQP